MTRRKRIGIAVLILIVLVGGVLGLDLLLRSRPEPTLPPGSIPIWVDGRLVGGFTLADLEQLQKVGFVDAEEGKTQEGWLLRDVLRLHVQEASLQPETTIRVSSSSRNKSVELTWAEVEQADNMVMFDLSNRGTLKLASRLEKLDTRDEWVQDVDRVEVAKPQ